MIDSNIVIVKLNNDESIVLTGVDHKDIIDTLQAVPEGCRWLIIKNVIINIDRIMYIEKVEKDDIEGDNDDI